MKSPVQSCLNIEEAAVQWFLTVRGLEDPPAELMQEWLAWMAASEEHRRAFEQVAQVWHGVTPALIERHADDSSADAYDGSTTVAQWREKSQSAGGSRVPRVMGRWMASLAVAASVVVATVFFAFEGRWLSNDTPVSAGTFATRAGEHMNLLLADGSHVTLGAHSRLRVNFSPQQRTLQLQEGEAYFLVAKDKNRPFEVRAMDSAITAVGTAFNVRAIEDRVTVTVTEGTVRVAEPGVAASVPVQLRHGQQVSYRSDDDAVIEPAAIKEVDAAESARWRDGWLVYRDEPLQFVVADVARYTELKFTVTDAAAQLQFSGAVFKDRIEEWITALPEVSPVIIERRGDQVRISTLSTSLVQLD